MFGDGVNARYLPAGEKIPEKHQLLMEFDDNSCIVCTVQMYGVLHAFTHGENDNFYYHVAKTKPSPLSKDFDISYFEKIILNLCLGFLINLCDFEPSWQNQKYELH